MEKMKKIKVIIKNYIYIFIYMISSMNVLDSFLWFEIQVMTLFIGNLTKTLSFPNVRLHSNGCCPSLSVLWGIGSGFLSPVFLSGMGPLVWAGSQNWSHEELVNEQSPAPSTNRARLCGRNELFF
jgi:hypothetical protein